MCRMRPLLNYGPFFYFYSFFSAKMTVATLTKLHCLRLLLLLLLLLPSFIFLERANGGSLRVFLGVHYGKSVIFFSHLRFQSR